MLALGAAGGNSYNTSNADDAGYFTKTLDLSQDVSRFIIQTSLIKHSGDTDFTDGIPGILIRNFKVHIEGVRRYGFDFVDGNNQLGGGSNILDPVTLESHDSISFGDTVHASSDFGLPSRSVYSDTFSISGTSGKSITVSGNVTLNNGTNSTYVGATGNTLGRLQILFNTTEANHIFVYIQPGVTASGNGNAQTVVVSA